MCKPSKCIYKHFRAFKYSYLTRLVYSVGTSVGLEVVGLRGLCTVTSEGRGGAGEVGYVECMKEEGRSGKLKVEKYVRKGKS